MWRRIRPALRYLRTGRIPDDVALNESLAALNSAFDRVDVEGTVVRALGLGIEIGPALSGIDPSRGLGRPSLTLIAGGAS